MGVHECITRLTLSAAGVALLITGGQPTSMIGCFDVFTLEGRACIHVHAKRKGLDWMYPTLDVQSACLVEFTELLSENNLCGPLVITFAERHGNIFSMLPSIFSPVCKVLDKTETLKKRLFFF